MPNQKQKYNLNFISDIDLFNHVKKTVEDYSFSIDLKKFSANVVDPVKLTFDKLIYKKTIADLINSEVIRQMDKSNNNSIGYFHQNIFKYIGGCKWIVPEKGFDIINEQKKIFVEMKNKHNTMNSSSSQKTYLKMSAKVQNDSLARCFLVEIIAKISQDEPWEISIDSEKYKSEKIRRMSIDKFYEIVTGEADAFKKLCQVLPIVIQDVVDSVPKNKFKNTVLKELEQLSPDILTSLYLLAFKTYAGFDDFVLQSYLGNF